MGLHDNQRVRHAGAPLDKAAVAMITLHGRGASPENILDLASAFERPHVAYIAPAAAGNAWYPSSFMSPREKNEPSLSSALAVIESLVVDLVHRGFPSHKIALLGFSQGACLSSEFSIRHPRRYGGLLALSGGLIGPPGTTWDDLPIGFDGMPVFLGCSDVDPHIPKERVIESAIVFAKLGARVERTLYPGMGHLVNDDEIARVQSMLDDIVASPHQRGGKGKGPSQPRADE